MTAAESEPLAYDAVANGSGGPRRGQELRREGRLAGWLFIGGALTSAPALFFLEPDPDPWIYLLTVLGVLSGAICVALPWERISPGWLHFVVALGTIEIAGAVAATDLVFSYLYFLIAVYCGLVFRRPWPIAAHLVLVGMALLSPLLLESFDQQEVLLWAAGLVPALALSAAVTALITEHLWRGREAYRTLSNQDGLTGVGNYRSLQERLMQETARHQRRSRRFAFLVIDLDGFKEVNESQGHLVGDLVLAVVGTMLDLEVRSEDMVFRQGGDEFSVLAPETDRDQAGILASRLEYALSSINAGPVQMTATVGTAIFPDDGEEPGDLFQLADAEMMARKRKGRRVRT